MEFGERTQDCSPGHTAKEGPHLVRTGASRGYSRSAAPVWCCSRGIMGSSGSLSCGARAARHTQVVPGFGGSLWNRLPQAAQLAVVAAVHQGGSGGAPRGTGTSRPHAGLLRGSGPGAGTLPSCPRAQNLSRVRSCLWGLEGRELGGVSGVDCRGAAGRGWGGSRGSSRAVQALPAHHGPVS